MRIGFGETWNRLLLCAGVGFGMLFAAPLAQADVRVWAEQEGDEFRYLDLTGFLQPGYIFRLGNDPNGGNTDDSFFLQRARTGIRAQLQPWLRFRVEVEFAPVATLQDAYIDVPFHPNIGVQAGQFQVPFLRTFQFNELQLAFIDRPTYVPLSPDRPFLRFLSPRDIGAMVHGAVGSTDPEDTAPALRYALGAFLGAGPNINRNDDGALLFAARVDAHLRGVPEGVEVESDLLRNSTPKVALGASIYSNCDDRTNWNRGFTVDSEFRWEGLYASTAFVWLRSGSATDSALGEALGYDSFCVGAGGTDPGRSVDFVSRGAHLQVQYVLPRRLLKEHDLEALFRVDWVDPSSPYDSGNPIFGGGKGSAGYIPPSRYSDADNAPTRFRATFGVNWFPTGVQSLRLQLNYQLKREFEDVVTADGTLVGIKDDVLWLQMTAGL